MRPTLIAAIAAGLLALVAAPALAAPGDLDPTFNGNGKLVFNPAGRESSVRGVAVQPDGKILLAGSALDPATNKHDFAVTRLNSDGTVDQGFGSGGTAIVDFTIGQSHSDATGEAVALQADGKIVVGGTISANNLSGPGVARLNPGGTLDPSFQTSGSGFAPGRAFVNALGGTGDVGVDASGRIVVVGGATAPDGSSDFLFARLLASGEADVDFGPQDRGASRRSTSADWTARRRLSSRRTEASSRRERRSPTSISTWRSRRSTIRGRSPASAPEAS